MGDSYLEIPLTAFGTPLEVGDPIRKPTPDGVTSSSPSVKGQSMNHPIQVDESANSESACFIKPDDLDYRLSKTCASVAALELKSTEEHTENRRTSDADTIKTYHQGIYWRSPITMVTFFLSGVFISAGHHLYYSSLVGRAVGNVTDQELVIRFGITFAFLAQVSLVTSVGFAFTQVLWRTLKNTEFSIQGIDAAFDLRSSLLSFLNWEMLQKMKIGAFIAVIAWCLPIPGLITPGTIFVNPSSWPQNVTAPVRCLNIPGTNQSARFAYSVPANGPDSQNSSIELFLGPRTIVSRLSVATATLGEILPIAPPFANASYQIQFYGPTVQCGDASSSVAATIDSLVQEQKSASEEDGAIEMENFYFAFVPDLSGPTTKAILANRFQQPANGSNQLWMTFQRYVINSMGAKVPQPRHLVCQLYNASYDLSLSFVENGQSITNNLLEILNAVDYPPIDPTTPSDLVQHAYSAYMWAFTDQLIGWIGIYNDSSLSNSSGGITEFSEIQTQIEHTSLLGSSDLDYFFDQNHDLFSNSTTGPNSDQRQQDIALAQNQTLNILIPELAFNTTLSFMTSDLLSSPINTTVLTTVSVNLYAYHSTNLFLAYGIAILFALLANILGGLAYHHNGVSHDTSFSSILSSTRDPGLAELFVHQVLGKLPLPREIKMAMLRFGRMSEGGLGFHRVVRDGVV